jgi:integrase
LARKPDVRPGTYRAIKSALKGHWKPLHRIELHRIPKADVAARLTELRAQQGPTAAFASRSKLSAFFVWAIEEGLCERNPVIGTTKSGKADTRDRIMTREELRTIWAALPDSDYGRIVKLVMITGARRPSQAMNTRGSGLRRGSN